MAEENTAAGGMFIVLRLISVESRIMRDSIDWNENTLAKSF